MGLLGKGPDAHLSLELELYTDAPGSGPVPCFAKAGGAAELVPYAPGAYLDKMLANLTHDRVEAAALATRVWEHVRFVWQAMDASDDDAQVLERHVRSPRVVLLAAPLEGAKPGRIRADVWVKMSRERLGAITSMKDGAANSVSGEIGFWAIWNWCANHTAERDGWARVAKQIVAIAEQLTLYGEAGQTPGMREGAKAPFQVMYALERAEAAGDVS